MILSVIDSVTIACLMIIGFWLEGIGGKHNLADELLAPFPLGLGGVMFVLFERF
ncbi:MAG: hypothetical protein WBW81_05975 [Methylocella sp.]